MSGTAPVAGSPPAPGLRARSLLVAALIVLGACRPRPGPPTAGAARGAVPDLIGAEVLVLPVQGSRGVAANPDADLGYVLRTRGGSVRWLMPLELREALWRSPALDVPLDALPVGVFLRAQVDRVGDPLYGYLRRLAAVAGGQLALIPIEVRHQPGTAERPGAIEVVAALIDVGSGRVAWLGVVDGEARLRRQSTGAGVGRRRPGPPVASHGRVVATAAMFEAVHGSAPDIAGQGVANPTGLLLSAYMMLDHLGKAESASRIRCAIRQVVRSGESRTRDMGGTAGTREYTAAICRALA